MTVSMELSNKVTSHLKITKHLQQKCSNASAIFKLYLNELLNSRGGHVEMLYGHTNQSLKSFTFHFSEDQVILAEYDNNMLR